jgi:hypothetical protein
MQGLLALRPRGARQQLLGTRTTRLLVGGLHDLEREMAKLNTSMFERTGLSYSYAPIEDELAAVPLLDRDTLQEVKFPSETASIFSRIEDRRTLLKRLMSRSRKWEESLGNVLGGVSFLECHGEGRAMFGADENGRVMLGTPADPWQELEERAIPFIDPILIEALFGDEVDGEEILQTPTYRDLSPWFYNDTNEFKVAQWHHDLTGVPLWAGSWMQYRISAGDLKEDDVTEVRTVKDMVASARERRAKLFGIDMTYVPRQQIWW